MTRIDQAGQIAAWLRPQVRAQGLRPPSRPDHSPRHAGPATVSASPGPGVSIVDARTEKDLASVSQEAFDGALDAATLARIRSLDPRDPQRARIAFRIFLESSLRRALGRPQWSDAGFHALVERVQRLMEESDTLRASVAEASEALLREAAGDGSTAAADERR